MNLIAKTTGRFTEFCKFWIPGRSDKGNIVTTVLEPNFTKLDELIKTLSTNMQFTSTEEIEALINQNN